MRPTPSLECNDPLRGKFENYLPAKFYVCLSNLITRSAGGWAGAIILGKREYRDSHRTQRMRIWAVVLCWWGVKIGDIVPCCDIQENMLL